VRVAPTRQLPRAERDGLLDLLRAAVTFGTGNVGNVSPYAYGKTGTTQDYRDALFVGFVGDMVIGVWVGNDDNSPMNGVAGAGLPAEIWRDFARYAMARGTVRVNGRQIGVAPIAPRPAPVEEIPLDVPPPDGIAPPVEGAPPVEAPAAPAQPVEPAPPVDVQPPV
jgi:membrane peptidoglycan carboxypeptidase